MRDYRSSTLLGLLLVVICLSGCANTNQNPASVTAAVGEFLDGKEIAGVAVSIGVGDRLVYSNGFGHADLEMQVKTSPSTTRFRVGSVSKSFTAMAVAQLYQESKLDLDREIQYYVPDFPEKEGKVTTRLLGGHLSGIRHYRQGERFVQKHYSSVTASLKMFVDDPLEDYPGSRFIYSSYGYNLISAAVEAASGMEFLDFMDRSVFARIGMSHTTADKVTPIIRGRSGYYTRANGSIENAPVVDNSYKWAGGGFLSTSEDLVRFGAAHLSDRVLNDQTVKMLWTSQQTSDGHPTGYGIGWFISSDQQRRRVIRHGGRSVGGTTELRIYPESKLVVAVISNTDISRADMAILTDTIVEKCLVADVCT